MILRILTLVIILSFTSSAFGAKAYKRATPDGTVEDREAIQVEETEKRTVKRVVTLSAINTAIAVRTTQISQLQAELTELNIMKSKVKAEADKVVLKVREVVEPVVPE